MNVNSDFKELLRLFSHYRVKYLVVGGYAVIKYTEPLADAWTRRVEVDFEGVPTYFISLQDLITTKQALGRPQDVIDIALLRQGLDDDNQASR